MQTELEALEKISKQLDGYKEELGQKADAAKVADTEKAINELKYSLNTLTEKEIDKSISSINTSLKDMHEQISSMREEMAKSKEGLEYKSKGHIKLKDIQESIKGFIEKRYPNGKKDSSVFPEIHLGAIDKMTRKAPENFGIPQSFVSTSQTDAYTGREVDPEFYQRRRKRNLILDHFEITSISVPKLYYLEKVEIGPVVSQDAGDPGSADWIASGGEKPKRSFRLDTGEVEAKKVAIFATAEDKLLRDVSSMENWIREDLMDEMLEAYNDALLNNNPAVNSDAPLGIKQNATTFTVTPAFDETVENPNFIDAIIAAIATMADRKERPSKVFISDDVFYAIHNLKSTDGKYLNNNLVYVNAVGQLFIAGVEVVAADREDVPSTHLLAISDSLGFKIRNYGGMVMEQGLNGEDFRYDRTSFRAYQEVLSYIPENRENSVLYDTFANIFTAIEKPEGGAE
jgi:HK97 family phage major capsid protein